MPCAARGRARGCRPTALPKVWKRITRWPLSCSDTFQPTWQVCSLQPIRSAETGCIWLAMLSTVQASNWCPVRPLHRHLAWSAQEAATRAHPILQPFARKLYRLARRLEKDLGNLQDIEWVVAGGRLYLLQSRPITTMQAYNSVTGEWNDSLTGDYLWTNANFGEAFPDVMTPFTWSMVERYLHANGVGREKTRYPLVGNIGGRLYINQSLPRHR